MQQSGTAIMSRQRVIGPLVAVSFISCLVSGWLVTRWRSFPSSGSGSFRTIQGRVESAGRPIAGARVRLKATSHSCTSDDEGQFSLAIEATAASQSMANPRVTAWKPGYFIGGAPCNETRLVIELQSHPIEDSPEYAWVDPTPDTLHEEHCGNCHPQIYAEWNASAHASSVSGRRLRNLFDGTDWHGNPNRGWNLLRDYPHGRSVCVPCHGPTIDENHPAFDDIRLADGAPAHGVHCDYCHKVQNASVENVGLTHGRYAHSLLRPTTGQLFFGPLDDVDRGEDVFSPLQSDSRLCASCHEGIVFGVHAYSTYSEWQASPAARRGVHCQNCHMAPTGSLANFAPNHGGVERDPKTLASHSFLPGGHEAMLAQCLQLTAEAKREEDDIGLLVELRASGVGHSVPTGFIDRHLILVVDARDATNTRLAANSGAELPAVVGKGLAGRPGRLFAKLLSAPNGRTPSPFWIPGVTMTDTRLKPNEPVRCWFHFPKTATSFRIRLIYRGFWSDVADEKRWPDDTITVFDRTIFPSDNSSASTSQAFSRR